MSFWEGAGAALLGGGAAILGSGGSRGDVAAGLRMETHYSMQKEDSLWQRAKARGLTPQEYYGSSAAGSSGVSGSAAQTLGNAASQKRQAMAGIMTEAYQRGQDRKNALDIAKVQADATKTAASTAAGAQTESATITQTGQVAIAQLRNLLEERKIKVTERQYEEIALPAAAANLALTTAQVEKAVNEIATTAPDFVIEKILLQMGFENTIQNMVLKRHGLDPTSELSMKSIDDDKYKEILTEMLGASSAVGRELRGLATTAHEIVQRLMNFGSEFKEHVLGPLGRPPTVGSTTAK